MKKLLVITLLIFFMSGCTYLDRYRTSFSAISVGDTDGKVLELMGTPDDEKSIEIPMVQAKQMIWKSVLGNKVYIVHCVMGRVIGKTKI
ncbi:hypothetical protein KBD45_07635 [Candidatus Dojkabacteria bacterium]|nr:hypothetical protein [Candidatus Dojkabacteria bacterium]